MWVGEKWLVERQLNIGGRAYATDLSPRPQRTNGPNNKNPPKISLPKIDVIIPVPETVLTNF